MILQSINFALPALRIPLKPLAHDPRDTFNEGFAVIGAVVTGVAFASTLTSATNSALVLAGAQDQGYQRGTVQTSTGPGPSTNLTQLISGDYGHLTSSDGTHAVVFSNYPGFTLVQEGQSNPSLTGYVDFPAGSNHLWLPPVVADPLLATSYFLCAERLYRFSKTAPGTWTSTIHSTQDFSAGSANYLTALTFAPSDAQRAYAVDDAGRLYFSTNHGTSWTQSASIGPNEHYFYGNTFSVHPTNALEAVVGGSGYSAPGVLRTVDGGQNWTDVKPFANPGYTGQITDVSQNPLALREGYVGEWLPEPEATDVPQDGPDADHDTMQGPEVEEDA